MEMPETIARWHAAVGAGDVDLLDALLADEAVFHSPALHAPQEGKELTATYLRAAFVVLGPTLTYRDEWYAADSAVLEFTAELDGLTVHGIDLIRWGQDGRITDFTVMARPFKGLQKLMEKMLIELVPEA